MLRSKPPVSCKGNRGSVLFPTPTAFTSTSPSSVRITPQSFSFGIPMGGMAFHSTYVWLERVIHVSLQETPYTVLSRTSQTRESLTHYRLCLCRTRPHV